jgi:deoxyribose-phosphate aldolase
MVDQAVKSMSGTGVAVCSVAAFPLGYNRLEDKIQEIENLYSQGCDEVDVVLNISYVKNKSWYLVEEEFKAFSKISEQKVLKIIIESGLLTEDEIIKICEIANKHKISFLKTSTGFADVSARLEDVKNMREHLLSEIQIKASGGIKNRSQAVAFIDAGADRLGCSASVKIVSED